MLDYFQRKWHCEVYNSHYKYTGRWEGDFQNWRMHLECYDASSEEISEGFSPFENERPKKAGVSLSSESTPVIRTCTSDIH